MRKSNTLRARFLYFLLRIKLKLKQFTKESNIKKVERIYPGYINYIKQLDDGGAMGGRAFPWRAIEQIRVLDISSPSSIIEFGSGTSSALFLEYLNKKENSEMVSFDESETYAKLTEDAIENYISNDKNILKIIYAPKKVNSKGSYYDSIKPQSCDLLYIDGPTVEIINGKKSANQDIIHMFEKNIYPKVIMVDGRIDTVKAILDLEGKNYKFYPSMMYSVNSTKNLITHIFNIFFTNYERHSVLIRK